MPLPARAAGAWVSADASGAPGPVPVRAARSPHGRRACLRRRGRWVCSRSPRGAVAVFALRASRRLFRPPLGGWDWNPFPVGVSDRLWILGICPEPVPVWRRPGSLAGRRVARPARGPSGRGAPLGRGRPARLGPLASAHARFPKAAASPGARREARPSPSGAPPSPACRLGATFFSWSSREAEDRPFRDNVCIRFDQGSPEQGR